VKKADVLWKDNYRTGYPIPKIWHHIGEDMSYMETMTHRQRAEIAAEKRSPFMPHRDLVALDLFLDTRLDRRIGKTCLIDYIKSLGNIYGNKFQTYRPKGKLTEVLS
jgi:hypothetical protein